MNVWTIAFYVESVPFTRDVIDGTASLGGSESACLGLARALKARGHDVHIIAAKLDEDCEGRDHGGVIWHAVEDFPALSRFIEWDVFISLRMFHVFSSGEPIRARLRLLWNQDLLTQPKLVMGSMWAVDQMVYVSDYHRQQFEDRLPELKQIPAFVTKNGFDTTRVPTQVTKDPNRIIHISRPERGLRPLLTMWPEVRKQHPRAEVRICRYSSMYDAQGWGRICASYDEGVEQVNQAVGGISYLGELGKSRLYQEIAEAAVMWYPGVHDFAETSCIAAVEAQACFPAETIVEADDSIEGMTSTYSGDLVRIETTRGAIEATTEHPFWTDSGWIKAGDLRAGSHRLLYNTRHASDETQDCDKSRERQESDSRSRRQSSSVEGRIGDVARTLQPHADARCGDGDGQDVWLHRLAEAQARVVEAVRAADTAPSGDVDADASGVYRWIDRWGGHRLYSEVAESPFLEAALLNREHIETADGLAALNAVRPVDLRRRTENQKGESGLLIPRGRTRASRSLPSAIAVLSDQARTHGAAYRVDGSTAVAEPQSESADATTTGYRFGDSKHEYETILAISRRPVAALAVYNLKTLSSTFYANGYLVHNCGTPFVGSFKGALPETVPSGVLVRGSADTPEYQRESIANLLHLLEGCQTQSFSYRAMQKAGRKHVERYTYDVIAGEWDAHLSETFRTRYASNKVGILRQMLHDDDHVAAKVVASDILREIMEPAPTEARGAQLLEAGNAFDFCDKVIAGRDQSAENYADKALGTMAEVEHERTHTGRMATCLKHFAGAAHVLDVACGNGAMAILLATTYPTIRVTGIDYAQGNIDAARKTAEEQGVSDRCTFFAAPFWDFDVQQPADFRDVRPLRDAGPFDAAFIGEFIEHVGACDRLIDYVETFLAPDAIVVYTCPHGPFTDLLARGVPIHRGHVHQFCHDDLNDVFGNKKDLAVEFLNVGVTARGAAVGHWVIAYHVGGGPAKPRNLAQRTLTCRPMRRLTAGLIVGPEELDLRRCLDSVWRLVDEIVIGDCGMDDTTRAVAQEFHAKLLPVGDVMLQPEGFAGARNVVLAAATGEDFLWIDADERLIGGIHLRKYLESGPYVGYALHQNHLMVDAQRNFDTPIRLFRRRDDIQFYGCVHEQPQMHDANGDVTPALDISDVYLVHTGYLVEPMRREKMLQRNLPLLKRDQKMFADRRLGRVLWLRDFVNIADYKRERAGGEKTPEVIALLKQTVMLFEREFADPADKYHALTRPWYERALQDLGIGIEMELALAGKRGGMDKTHAKPRRIWVREHADLARILNYELGQIKRQMQPEALKTDPFVTAPEPQEVTA